MSMSIVNNIPAFNSQRQLGIIGSNLAKSIQRLSTGLRINNASDDAAGLAISERLRSSINSLVQGTVNAQDSISVVQTAEGAMDTAGQILQRMKTLATTAASAAKSDSDRALLQVEVDQLTEELSRLGDTTAFAGQNLLDGSIARAETGTGTTLNINSNAFIGAQSTQLVASVFQLGTAAGVTPIGAFSMANETFQLKVVGGVATNTYSVLIFSSLSTASDINSGAPLASVSLGGGIARDLVSVIVPVLTAAGGSFVISFNAAGMTFSTDQIGKTAFVSSTASQITSTADKSLYIQIGAGSGEVIKVFAPSVRPQDLFSNQSTRLDTFVQAEGMINQVDQAINNLSKSRAVMGALQNRFQNAIANNNVYQENLTASESRIRDLNVAAETTNFAKNQILNQSATAFLAQANLLPQSVLQLIR